MSSKSYRSSFHISTVLEKQLRHKSRFFSTGLSPYHGGNSHSVRQLLWWWASYLQFKHKQKWSLAIIGKTYECLAALRQDRHISTSWTRKWLVTITKPPFTPIKFAPYDDGGHLEALNESNSSSDYGVSHRARCALLVLVWSTSTGHRLGKSPAF